MSTLQLTLITLKLLYKNVKKKKPSLAETVSRNIRKARLEVGLTQKELADKAGFKVSYIARLETKPQNLSLGVIERLAKALALAEGSFLRADKEFSPRSTDTKLHYEARDLIQRLTRRMNED